MARGGIDRWAALGLRLSLGTMGERRENSYDTGRWTGESEWWVLFQSCLLAETANVTTKRGRLEESTAAKAFRLGHIV